MKRTRHINRAPRKRPALSLAEIRTIASDPASADVLTLIPGNSGLGAEAVRAIADSPHLVGMRTLGLGGNPIGDEGLRAIAGSPVGRELERLFVGGCEIGDAGARALVEAAPPRLKQLGLGNNHIGAEALAGLVALTTLEELDLTGTGVDDGCARALLRGLPKLRRLTLWRSKVTREGCRKLLDARRDTGYVRIYTDYNGPAVTY